MGDPSHSVLLSSTGTLLHIEVGILLKRGTGGTGKKNQNFKKRHEQREAFVRRYMTSLN